MLHQVFTITLLASLMGPSTPPSLVNPSARVDAPRAVLSRALVANPYVATVDSAASVAVGNRMRDRLAQIIDKGYWVVTSRAEMNRQLVDYGFSPDGILPVSQVLSLARSGVARAFVTSEMTKSKDGTWTLKARFVGMGTMGMAGHVFTLTQTAGSVYTDLGMKIADSLNLAFKAYVPAKDCFEAVDDKKAIEAADKSFKVLPSFGMATRCLADMEWKKDTVSDGTVNKMIQVTKADPLSIDTYNRLAVSYFARTQTSKSPADSAKVVETYQTMVRVSPSDQTLLLNAVNVFKAFGKPDAADSVAADMLRLDPASLDGLNLASNSAIGKGTNQGFKDALEYLERYYLIDSTKADTTFYSKVTYASQQLPDTAKLVLWSARAIKYSNSAEFNQAQGYGRLWSKDYAGAIKSFQIVAALDPEFGSDAKRLFLTVEQAYLDASEVEKAVALLPIAKRSGSQTLLEDASNVILGAAQKKYNAANAAVAAGAADPKLWAATVTLADAYLAIGTGDAKNESLAALYSMYGNIPLLPALATALGGADAKNCTVLLAGSKLVERVEKLRAKAAEAALPKTNSDAVIDGLKGFTDFLPGAIKDNNCGS